MSEKLLNCPFCGKPVAIAKNLEVYCESDPDWIIGCCVEMFGKGRDELANLWNTRPNTDAAKLRMALGDLVTAVETLPQDIFGTGNPNGETNWFVRDELIGRAKEALEGNHGNR